MDEERALRGTIIRWAVFGFILLAALLFGANDVGLINLKVWGPEVREAQREIFEESQSFVHGKITHINRLRLEYQTADTDSRKSALRTMILSEVAVLERDNLPDDLKQFVDSLERNVTP